LGKSIRWSAECYATTNKPNNNIFNKSISDFEMEYKANRLSQGVNKRPSRVGKDLSKAREILNRLTK
jgi:hypothetical protein